VCTKQEEARIVLLNPITQYGRELVANWGDSPGTIFLNSSWVDKCKEADRALLAKDGWAGCLLDTQEIAARAGDMDNGFDDEDDDARVSRVRPKSAT
jgi:hypothetical protein